MLQFDINLRITDLFEFFEKQRDTVLVEHMYNVRYVNLLRYDSAGILFLDLLKVRFIVNNIIKNSETPEEFNLCRIYESTVRSVP